jgi:NAD-dependent dihydropyrimidine dehydrogenase PreA subunit
MVLAKHLKFYSCYKSTKWYHYRKTHSLAYSSSFKTGLATKVSTTLIFTEKSKVESAQCELTCFSVGFLVGHSQSLY